MKHSAILFLCLAFLSGCQASGIRGYWNNVPLLENDLRVSEDRFTAFAEMAAEAPEAEALAAMDNLFDRLRTDTVAYYIYADWIDAAFYSIYSPCRNAGIYCKAVERFVSDAILTGEECEPLLRKRQWIGYNLPGEKAMVPGRNSFEGRTLVLVLDASCPSCRTALDKFGTDPLWADAHHLAVLCGPGFQPGEDSGWEFVLDKNVSAVFDAQLTPIYFVVAPDGIVEEGYKLAL